MPADEPLARPDAPGARSGRLRRGVWLGLLFTAGALAMIRPSPGRITTSLPANLGDPALITWILGWGAHALVTAPQHYFAANAFWPHPSPLAYSDLITPFVPFFGVTYWLSHSWALAVNVCVLIGYVGSLAATYWLAHWVTGRRDAAVVAAFGFSFSGFVIAAWSHVQFTTVGLVPLSAVLLGYVLERRRLLTAAAFGVVTAAVSLGAVYYGVIWSVSVALIVAGYWVAKRGRPGPRFVRCFAVAGLAIAALAGPAAYKYLQLQRTENHVRGYEPTFSMKGRDLLTPPTGSYVWRWLAPHDNTSISEHGLFPGAVMVVLGGVGVVVLLRRRRGALAQVDEADDAVPVVDPDARWLFLLLLAAAAALSLVLAAGGTFLGHASPYRFFHDHVPGFKGIRVTARFAVVAVLALAMAAAVGYAELTRRIRSTRVVAVAAAAAIVVVCIDLAAPLPWARLPASRATLAVYRALAHEPPGAAVELPMADLRTPGAEWAYLEAPRMVYSTLDWHPRVNGYSGFAPSTYTADVEAFAKLPDPSAFAHARQLRVRYLVLHVGVENGFPVYRPDQVQAILAALPAGANAAQYGSAWLVDLGPAPSP